MIDDPTNPDTTPAPAPVLLDPVNAQSKALADAAVLAEKQHTDEGEEGGHYIVNGVDVNSDGKPIKKNARGKWDVIKDGQ
jgi:hypothetical protein